MNLFSYKKGISINGSSLWLDSSRTVERCVVSHAHMDHARKHKLVIATEPTLEFLKRRMGKTRGVALAYRQRYELDRGHLMLYPAGHILGSAQVLVELNGRRLLYSGDFNMEKSVTAEPIAIPECDELVMECTFGLSHYRFPKRADVEQQLIDAVSETLRQKQVPVVAGYALGKSQEAMKILGDAGFELSVHGSVAVLAKVYEQFGIDFGSWQKYRKAELPGKVLIVPRVSLRSRLVQNLVARRVFFLTGWAIDPAMQWKEGFDEVLPLSDHSDFDGLIEYVKRTRANRIYTTHGPKAFASTLRAFGFDAMPVEYHQQLSLF